MFAMVMKEREIKCSPLVKMVVIQQKSSRPYFGKQKIVFKYLIAQCTDST